MKHLLNDMSQDEMNSIREQHTGGKELTIENFSNMVNKKLGEVPTILSESEPTMVGTEGFAEVGEQSLAARIRQRKLEKQSGKAQKNREETLRKSRVQNEKLRGRLIAHNREVMRGIDKYMEIIMKDIRDKDMTDGGDKVYSDYYTKLKEMMNNLQKYENDTLKTVDFGLDKNSQSSDLDIK
jgi:hypothetical protein